MKSDPGLEVMGGDDSSDPGEGLLDITDTEPAAREGDRAALKQFPADVGLLPFCQLLQHLGLLRQRGLGFRQLQEVE